MRTQIYSNVCRHTYFSRLSLIGLFKQAVGITSNWEKDVVSLIMWIWQAIIMSICLPTKALSAHADGCYDRHIIFSLSFSGYLIKSRLFIFEFFFFLFRRNFLMLFFSLCILTLFCFLFKKIIVFVTSLFILSGSSSYLLALCSSHNFSLWDAFSNITIRTDKTIKKG